MEENKRVLLGMSGGVDSSVAAFLLKEQGYEVIGVTMQIWQDEQSELNQSESGCCSLSAVEDARRVASKIDIPFYVMNFKDVFKTKVIDYFIDEYIRGRTPNPCIACNKHVKFDEFLRRAFQLDCYYIATGHYAKIVYSEALGRYLLKTSDTPEKDQTYALYNMSQEQLRHTLMPLGYYNKEQIREIAKKLDLPVAFKPDSQEICFVPDNDYARYVQEKSNHTIPEGNFVNKEGKVIGEHKGIIHYTIGQRKGLGIALGKPAYVIDIRPERNEVVIGSHEEVLGKELIAEDINFIPFDRLKQTIKVKAKIRYTALPQPATVYPHQKNTIKVVFDYPQRAITPGQSVVLYDGEIVVGGGIIVRQTEF